MGRKDKAAKGGGRAARAGTPAMAELNRAGVDYRVHTWEHDPRGEDGYGREAAAALGVEADRVFKTLVALADGRPVVAVVPVDGRLDLKALAQAVGASRVTMAPADQAERLTGYVVGGISPLGGRRRLTTVVDSSAETRATILVSGGRRGLDVELAPADLVRLTGGSTAPVARRDP